MMEEGRRLSKSFVHIVSITWSTQLCSVILNSCLLAMETSWQAAPETEALSFSVIVLKGMVHDV